MVLEHLFPDDWLEKKALYAFILAVLYSVIGIFAARLIFGSNSGIVSVVFVSILLIPSMRNMFRWEERKEEKEKRFTWKHLWRDNKDVLKAYFSIFFGIFFTYMFFSFILPQMGVDTFNVLKEQLFLDPALRGHAFETGTFASILVNNWWVLVVCFIFSLFTGDGALFFIAWNASAWGTIFGYRALTASLHANVNPWYFLLIILGIVIWHVILESGAYIVVATAGSVISRDIVSKSGEVGKFLIFLFLGGGLTVLFVYMLRMFVFNQYLLVSTIALMFIIVLYCLSYIFNDRRHKEVFTYNFYLFLIGLAIFILGALLETLVLSNSITLNRIYEYSYIFSSTS